jgi:hypothetical protein
MHENISRIAERVQRPIRINRVEQRRYRIIRERFSVCVYKPFPVYLPLVAPGNELEVR